jgi:hypothetical protein
MFKKGTIITSILILAVMTGVLVTGCSSESGNTLVPTDPFTTTWHSPEEGWSFRISGDSAGHMPGETSEFQLELDNTNGKETMEGRYCVLLVDENGPVHDITGDQFAIPTGSKKQTAITVTFFGDREGPLGLCIVIPERAAVVTTVWVGTDRSGAAGPWPSIETCP